MKSKQNPGHGSRRPNQEKAQKLRVDLGIEWYLRLLNLHMASLSDLVGYRRIEAPDELSDLISDLECEQKLARVSGDVNRYIAFASSASLLKKLELPIFDKVGETFAINEWLRSESICKEFNRSCLEILRNPAEQTELAVLLSEMKEEITGIIGENPPDLPEVARFFGFGPKADLTHAHGRFDPVFKGYDSSAYKDMATEVEWLVEHTSLREHMLHGYLGISRRGLASLDKLSARRLAMESVQWYDHNRFATVPKSVDKKRSIAVEPSLAVFVQRGYDVHLRGCLRKIGIDLSSQTQNQILAFRGSLNLGDNPCTIDLTSCSDRISYALVAMVLPRLWFEVLRPLIARNTLFTDGLPDNRNGLVELNKFSSMGNCITFPLQTLIFSALVRLVLKRRGLRDARWRVYGDDIIVPESIFDEVVEKLQLLGMEPNLNKSFKVGSFRESCGVDYLQGQYVRPFHFKKPIAYLPDLYKYLNLLQIKGALLPMKGILYREIYHAILDTVPGTMKFYGAQSEHLDSHIWVDGDVAPTHRIVRREGDTKVPSDLWYFRLLLIGSGRGDVLDARPYRRSIPRDGEPELKTVRSRGLRDLALEKRQTELVFNPVLIRA
jgi:hypothetical protein